VLEDARIVLFAEKVINIFVDDVLFVFNVFHLAYQNFFIFYYYYIEMAEPIVEKEKEENNTMDISTPAEETVNEGMEVSQNADQIIEEKEAEMPEPEAEPEGLPAPEDEPMEVNFPPPTSNKSRRAKCPPGCMRKPKCTSTGGKRSKKSKKTKGGKKSRKGGKKYKKGGRKSRKSKK